MNARWVSHTFWPELPQVEHTVIAMWWPWEYYCVSTTRVCLENQEPIYKSTRNNSDLPEEYVTHISQCDKDGMSEENRSYYTKRYIDLALAKKGHREVVELMEIGRLKIKR